MSEWADKEYSLKNLRSVPNYELASVRIMGNAINNLNNFLDTVENHEVYDRINSYRGKIGAAKGILRGKPKLTEATTHSFYIGEGDEGSWVGSIRQHSGGKWTVNLDLSTGSLRMPRRTLFFGPYESEERARMIFYKQFRKWAL